MCRHVLFVQKFGRNATTITVETSAPHLYGNQVYQTTIISVVPFHSTVVVVRTIELILLINPINKFCILFILFLVRKSTFFLGGGYSPHAMLFLIYISKSFTIPFIIWTSYNHLILRLIDPKQSRIKELKEISKISLHKNVFIFLTFEILTLRFRI